MRTTLLFSLLLLLTSSAVGAQSRPAACGTLPEAEERLTSFADYFVLSEYAYMRAGHINQLQPSDTQLVVADSAVCQQVYAAAVARLRADGTETIDLSPGKHEFVVLRYGPYYAIQLMDVAPPPSNPPVVGTGWSMLMIFTGPGTTFHFGVFI